MLTGDTILETRQDVWKKLRSGRMSEGKGENGKEDELYQYSD